MPVKIFKHPHLETLENEINKWLATLERGNEVKQVQVAADRSERNENPDLFVTIHYVSAQEPN